MDITLHGVSFGYGRKPVLRDIDWTIRPGVTGLLGENGAGKTTLLSVLVGLLRPKSGSITLPGDTTPRFGFVPQRFSLPGEMRAADCVQYTAWINGVSRAAAPAAAERALASVDLSHKASARVRSLSGGQRQRLGVAAGLAHDPDVLVLDEPTVGLDPSQRVRIREVIAKIGETRTVLLSTHVLEDVRFLCQRVGVLARGKLAFDGTVEEIEAKIAGDGSAPSRLESILERGYRTLLDTLGDDD
ncbi:ATP-binding cassette domain-containing protein [Kibdelosporangium philippinense]|uniref:ATP-binding cassette domain-containing protein n=1 Tax=Kibdelosporangium philippinense TaxID=211113 RepID=A0ABS8ZR77_9PSEU|nr:ATP-binding cassette domain-containing protein [Kibdelosporangium philippinense]MCE7010268.1 ATP-binding cassette domain-containing protein [Kibdelosporangium philippinense]